MAATEGIVSKGFKDDPAGLPMGVNGPTLPPPITLDASL